MNLEKIHKVVSHIKATLFKNSNAYSIGKLKSNVRGSGLQFKDYQVYCPGDDVRFIDWKLLARTGNPYIKLYEEERNVEVVILIDFSYAMLYGSNQTSKFQAILEISFLLLLLFEATGDRARFILLTQRPINIFPLKGEEGIAKIMLELEKRNLMHDGKINTEYSEKSSITETEKQSYLNKYLKKNKEIIYFSEFEKDNYERISAFFKNKRAHLFRVQSSLDYAAKFPYSILGKVKKKINTESGYFRTSTFEEEKENKIKRITTLKVEEKYLEQFVKKFL